jgi:hypothetical protein
MWVVALQAVVRAQDAALTVLQADVAALKSKVGP